MNRIPLHFTVTSADQNQERLAIAIGRNPSGEATVRYEEATATVDARVNMGQLGLGAQNLNDFHLEFASELMAFIHNRGAMAQEQQGEIRYEVDGRLLSMQLPTNEQVGLGYPNSW